MTKLITNLKQWKIRISSQTFCRNRIVKMTANKPKLDWMRIGIFSTLPSSKDSCSLLRILLFYFSLKGTGHKNFENTFKYLRQLYNKITFHHVMHLLYQSFMSLKTCPDSLSVLTPCSATSRTASVVTWFMLPIAQAMMSGLMLAESFSIMVLDILELF